jgi:DNA-binding response OmpR family regulator
METKKIILITEDDSSLRGALHQKLVSEGFDVFEAKNGSEGLEIALREHPDLILIDILMPKMNGLDMLKKLCEDEWGKNVHFIILTNISGTEEISEAMKLAQVNKHESFEYFVKSNIKIEEVIEKIKQKLGV